MKRRASGRITPSGDAGMHSRRRGSPASHVTRFTHTRTMIISIPRCARWSPTFHSLSPESNPVNSAKMTRCADCGAETPEDQLAKPLCECESLTERLDPGSKVPAGECQCGAFAYLITAEATASTDPEYVAQGRSIDLS